MEVTPPGFVKPGNAVEDGSGTEGELDALDDAEHEKSQKKPTRTGQEVSVTCQTSSITQTQHVPLADCLECAATPFSSTSALQLYFRSAG